MQAALVMIVLIGPKGVWTAKLVVSKNLVMVSRSLAMVSKRQVTAAGSILLWLVEMLG